MTFKKIGVVGAGMMGAEIALCFARAEYAVVLGDISMEYAESGKNRQASILDKAVAKGKMDAARKDAILDRVMPTADLRDMADCDMVIEAVLEVADVKKSVFEQLAAVCKPEAVIASNTSSISITKLAAMAGKERAPRFIGTHFNSPASIMKLVEVIPALRTDADVVADVIALLKSIDKEPVTVKDVVGFGLNRIFHCMYLEACRLVEEGVCTPEDADKICVHGLGHPVGIFKLLDMLGHDLNLNVDTILFEAYGDRFRPSPQIQRLVDAGRLGRKNGAGFYEYD